MSGDIVCWKGKFIIFRSGTGIVAYNTTKPFEEGHTHLKSIRVPRMLSAFVSKVSSPRESSFTTSRAFSGSLIMMSKDCCLKQPSQTRQPKKSLGCFPADENGKDAYVIKYLKGDTEFHRRCMEYELSEDKQIHLDDISELFRPLLYGSQ